MNDKELKIAADLLEEYSDRLGDEVCNDWDFPVDWSKDEIARFVWEYHEWNGDPEEYSEDHLHLPDFCVAGFLAHKLAKARIDEEV